MAGPFGNFFGVQNAADQEAPIANYSTNSKFIVVIDLQTSRFYVIVKFVARELLLYVEVFPPIELGAFRPQYKSRGIVEPVYCKHLSSLSSRFHGNGFGAN